MASTVNEIDNYLKKNKKQFFAMLNSHWGKNDDDAKDIKLLWNSALDSKGINNKIESFNKLKTRLMPFIEKAEKRLPENEKILEENGIEKFAYPEDQLTLEMDRMFTTLGNFPHVNELDDLSINDAYSQGYNYNQMRQLASNYGYDYSDKEERKEFLDKLAKYQQEKDIEKIWNDDIYTNLVTPVAKEYAKRNYQNIDSDDYIGLGPVGIPTNGKMFGAVAADVGVNSLMAASPTKFGAQLYTAPVARAGANMALNKHSLEDAAKEAGSEALTNLATPFALRGFYRWGARTKQGFEEKAKQAVKEGAKNIQKAQESVAQNALNKSADKARDIQNQLKNGAAIVEDGKYYKFGKDGRKIEITDEAELSFRPVISEEDYSFYLKNKDVMRGKQWGPDAESITADINRQAEVLNDVDKLIPGIKDNFKKQVETGISSVKKAQTIRKLRENIKNNKPATEGIAAEDLALITGKKAKETKFNWAGAKAKEVAESDAGQLASNYITNLQGRSKYGGSVANTIAQAIPGLEGKVDLTVKKKPDVENDPELQLIKRLYDLHKKFPDMVGKPKLPKKWENDYTIESIFGGE